MTVRPIALRDATASLVLMRLMWSCRWPLGAVVLGFSTCAALAAKMGDSALLQVGLWLLLHVLCLLGGFLVHEWFHIVGMRLFHGVSHVVVSAGVLRFSIIPVGRLYGWQVAAVALLGPGASCLVGGLIALLIPSSTLQYWFLLHAIFLLPFFGDGRGFLFGIRRWARLVGLRAPGVNR